MITKDTLYEELIKKRKVEVGNFDIKVQTSALLFNFFQEKDYSFFFCPKIFTNEEKTEYVTPDFKANKESKPDLIGEIKQSLVNPEKDYFEKCADKDMDQLKAYSGKLIEISTPHTVFFVAPQRCNEAISEYAKRIQSDPKLKDSVVIIKYYWSPGEGHSRLNIDKVYGDFKDEDLQKEFEFKGYQCGEGDLEKIQGGYKILYTEERNNETPVEYIMMVLWYNVIPELIKTSDKNKAIERIKKGENTLEFEIDDLKKILDKLYTLPTSEISNMTQFGKKMLIESMDNFTKINKAMKLNDSTTNPKYRVSFSKIAKQKADLIEYLIRELNKKEYNDLAEIEFKKQTNQSLDKF